MAPAGAALIAAAGWALWRGRGSLGLVLTAAALGVLLIGTGQAGTALLAGRPPAARAVLGSGFWVSAAAIGFLAVEQARRADRAGKFAAAAGSFALLASAASLGTFDQLSLAVEYRARAGALQAALFQHLWLSAAALALGAALAVPLAAAAFRRPKVDWAAGGALSIVQVTPALALFGLLIPLVAALLALLPALRTLGLSAIGPTPALIGVALYLALPLYRGVVTGLRAADPAIVEAARAMGMHQGQVTREVRVPLGAPALLGALRVAAVQSIGLVTLGGLIGAGGLGTIVFQGMSQLAPDLILLGALPVIALGIAADRVLTALQTATRRSR